MSNSDSKLARKTFRNAIWNYGAFALSKGVVFINTVILARLLAPEDFGILALGLLVIAYLEVVNDFGISAALIYRQEDPEYTANVAFGFNMLTGVLLTVVGFLVAPLAADFFEEPQVTTILRVLSLSFVISSVGSIHDARLRKELRFKRRMLPEIGKAAAKGLVSIPLALAGYGVWSLVWGQIAGAAAASIMYWWAYPWIPKLRVDIRTTRALLNYGTQMILIGIMGQVYKNVDYLLIGKRMDSAQLGFYTLAFRLPELIIINLVTVIGNVMFPTYARLQHDPNALRQGFLTTIRVVSLFTIPVGLGMFIIAPDFVTLFYTSRWAAAIPVMQVLSLYAVIYSLSYNCGDIYKAMGRPDILNKLAVVKLAVTVPILYVAASYSIYYVALGQLFTMVILTLLRLAIANRIFQSNFREIFKAIQPAVFCALFMTVTTMSLRLQLSHVALLPKIILLITFGALIYLGTFWFLYRDMLRQAVTIVWRQPRQQQSIA